MFTSLRCLNAACGAVAGMVKYATALPRESIVDLEGTVTCPEKPIEACSQSGVELRVASIRCISRAAPLPFEVIDAARSTAAIATAAEQGEQVCVYRGQQF